MKQTKSERQHQVLKNWKLNNFQGIFEAATGFGKTYTAIQGIIGMKQLKKVSSTLVIVPTIELQNQWNKELIKHKIKDVQVLVVNTAIKTEHNVDFLILDEIHRFAADTFVSIFKKVNYSYILGLTATLEREDGKHELILNNLKIIDTVTVKEALENDWISPFNIYNIAVNFNTTEAIAYEKADNAFKHFAAQLGYSGQAFKEAKIALTSDDPILKGRAMAYYRSLRNRKTICTNNFNKIVAVKQISEAMSDRIGLIFSGNTEFADKLQNELGDTCLTFHSKISKKAQKEVIRKFKDGRTKIRMLSTVQALNEGFDVPNCSLGIIAGSTSIKRTFIQQLGRTVRAVPGKKAIVVNLYTPNTQEEVWLKKRTEGLSNMIECDLETFLEKIKKHELST